MDFVSSLPKISFSGLHCPVDKVFLLHKLTTSPHLLPASSLPFPHQVTHSHYSGQFCSLFPCSPPPPSLCKCCSLPGLLFIPTPSSFSLCHFSWKHQELWRVWVLPSLQANLLASPQLHRCWEKKRDTWVRERWQFLNHSIAESRVSSFWFGFLSPISQRVMWRGLSYTCACSGLHYRRGTQSLGNPNLLYWAVSVLTCCSRGRCYLCLPRLFTVQRSLKG